MASPRLVLAVVVTAAGFLACTATGPATAATATTTHTSQSTSTQSQRAQSQRAQSQPIQSQPIQSQPLRDAATPLDGIRPLTGVSYSYWGFYQWNAAKHAWQFSPVGANDKQTAGSTTGAVYGFRWALVVKTPRPPRAAGDFAAICGDAKAPAGKKRIAFVLDFGTAADSPSSQRPPAPRGACAVVPSSATVQQALDSVASLRTNSSALICGIDGYPSSGCGQKIANATPPPPDGSVQLQLAGGGSSSDSGSSSLPWVIVAIVVIAALGVGAWLLRARRA